MRYTHSVQYRIRRSQRARALRVSVHPGGEVVVTAPHRFDLAAVERFLEEHAAWVRRHVEKTREDKVIRLARRDIPRLKRDALALAEERCAHYAARYGVRFNKLSIRAQKTRWGSCSKSGNLSFNYKIAALPRPLAEYVIVHEICHLLQFDHSARFWEHVARTIPDHRTRRQQMRRIAFSFA